ncbi:F-box only protein 43 isoform X2 [Hyla sarda]|uniref:F-box only protein 43 isoform X2 n=1 Tax=Hyla sarda TaxID=327740 RepID=UPI0024C3F4AC|nr:F-box only protein 43 isoform X2 [Hyla sarda]
MSSLLYITAYLASVAYRRKKSDMAYKRCVLDSPAVTQASYVAGAKKHVGYRSGLMYLSQDSGYNDSLKPFSPDSETSSDSLETGSPSEDYENSENVDPTLACSPIRRIIFEPGACTRNISQATEIYETPRVAKKDFSLRRRLLLVKATSGGNLDFDASDSSSKDMVGKKTLQRIPSFEAGLYTNFVDSPRDVAYEPIATSTLKIETESSMSCKKWRLNFALQKSSTIDESKGDTVPFPEVVNLSPVQHSTESTDGILSINKGNLTDLPTTPQRSLISEDKVFQTPISNLAASFRFNLCTPVTDQENSITEDSAFHSLSLDKSQDSITDHEGSFQELIQKQKETPKSTHNKSRLRKLDRCRRLSTLRERGSQSEVEEEAYILSSSYKSKMTRNSVTEECEFSFDDSTNSVLKFEDLTGTPALRVVREMIVRSTRKRAQQATMQELLGSLDCLDVSDDDLTRLIGRKMGLEQIDILSELKNRNLKHIISIIFKVLNVESICSIWKVSKEWREMVTQDKDACQRRKLFLKKRRDEAEEGWMPSEDAATRLNLLNRSVLKSVQAQAKSICHTPTSCGLFTPKNTAPVPQSASKQQEYVKIAKTLFTDEALKPCPQCQYPAKYQPLNKRGKCSRKDCGFDFCILCLCAFHGSKECSSGSGKRVHKKDVIPGSAKSKRNLKRL